MARAIIIKRHSTKKYKKKKPVEAPKVDKTRFPPKKPTNDGDGKAVKPVDPNKTVYTYILKDIVRLIYKIGKTTNPHNRFKNLCVRGRVVPIALVSKDIEGVLHTMYADNRIFNEEYKHNGGTEWFKTGGKFDEFISGIDKGQVLPFITLHTLVIELMEENIMKANDSNTQWELSQSKLGYYFIGLEILLMLGYITKTNGGTIISKDSKNILLIGRKISVSEEILNEIKSKYTFFVSTSLKSSAIVDNKKDGSRLRRIDLKSPDFDSEVFLLLNSVL